VAVLNVGTAGLAYIPTVAIEGFAESEFNATQINLPLSATICRTNAQAQCQPNTVEGLAPGAFATFSVFVHATADIGFKPNYTARVVVNFDGTRPVSFPPRLPGPMATYASTSVAVRTAP
jgi:hypothetical protein